MSSGRFIPPSTRLDTISNLFIPSSEIIELIATVTTAAEEEVRVAFVRPRVGVTLLTELNKKWTRQMSPESLAFQIEPSALPHNPSSGAGAGGGSAGSQTRAVCLGCYLFAYETSDGRTKSINSKELIAEGVPTPIGTIDLNHFMVPEAIPFHQKKELFLQSTACPRCKSRYELEGIWGEACVMYNPDSLFSLASPVIASLASIVSSPSIAKYKRERDEPATALFPLMPLASHVARDSLWTHDDIATQPPPHRWRSADSVVESIGQIAVYQNDKGIRNTWHRVFRLFSQRLEAEVMHGGVGGRGVAETMLSYGWADRNELSIVQYVLGAWPLDVDREIVSTKVVADRLATALATTTGGIPPAVRNAKATIDAATVLAMQIAFPANSDTFRRACRRASHRCGLIAWPAAFLAALSATPMVRFDEQLFRRRNVSERVRDPGVGARFPLVRSVETIANYCHQPTVLFSTEVPVARVSAFTRGDVMRNAGTSENHWIVHYFERQDAVSITDVEVIAVYLGTMVPESQLPPDAIRPAPLKVQLLTDDAIDYARNHLPAVANTFGEAQLPIECFVSATNDVENTLSIMLPTVAPPGPDLDTVDALKAFVQSFLRSDMSFALKDTPWVLDDTQNLWVGGTDDAIHDHILNGLELSTFGRRSLLTHLEAEIDRTPSRGSTVTPETLVTNHILSIGADTQMLGQLQSRSVTQISPSDADNTYLDLRLYEFKTIKNALTFRPAAKWVLFARANRPDQFVRMETIKALVDVVDQASKQYQINASIRRDARARMALLVHNISVHHAFLNGYTKWKTVDAPQNEHPDADLIRDVVAKIVNSRDSAETVGAALRRILPPPTAATA